MTNENTDFIRKIVADDIANGQCQKVVTRFPPEPNGYLHIGHAKAVSISADIASEHNGQFILRMDDTNPVGEEQRFIDAIQQDLTWLGLPIANAAEELRYASDYFDTFYQFAGYLIEQGLAYVDQLDSETMNAYRGSPTVAGQNSPYRQRPVGESVALLAEMRSGKHPKALIPCVPR